MAVTLDPEFAQKLTEALTKVSTRDVGPITAERPIRELGLDSITVAEMVLVLEDELNIGLEQNDVMALETFGDLQDLVEKARAKAQSEGRG